MRPLVLFLGVFGALAHWEFGIQAGQSPPALSRADARPAVASQGPAGDSAVVPPQPFDEWLAELRKEALERGFSANVVQHLEDLQPLERVIASDRSQAELNPGFNRYLSTRLTRAMVRRGQEQARAYRTTLSRVERQFDVPQEILVAVWGLETRYGRLTGRTPVLQALATLAWEPRRSSYFRGELFDALTMVSQRHVEARSMTGSWAGAMGQTQFMPSSYLKHAVDFDKDGKSDIWRSTPDALASIASYLKAYGWDSTYTWGREVSMPAAVRASIGERVPKRTEGCYARRNMTERLPLNEWSGMGVTREDGGPLPRSEVPAGLVDVGERQFLVYPNYDAILGYNCAHYYALTVALLADRLK
jgi:membrane-bound lytic murein transglycosylase B